jgi:transcription elongation GreA/GreB family factor
MKERVAELLVEGRNVCVTLDECQEVTTFGTENVRIDQNSLLGKALARILVGQKVRYVERGVVTEIKLLSKNF